LKAFKQASLRDSPALREQASCLAYCFVLAEALDFFQLGQCANDHPNCIVCSEQAPFAEHVDQRRKQTPAGNPGSN
jgi:hypothetical protein